MNLTVENKPWYKSKTIWTGIAGVVGAVGAGVTGETSTPDAIQIGLNSLLAVFLRLGIIKN